jgi:hypothetical protein
LETQPDLQFATFENDTYIGLCFKYTVNINDLIDDLRKLKILNIALTPFEFEFRLYPNGNAFWKDKPDKNVLGVMVKFLESRGYSFRGHYSDEISFHNSVNF